MTNIPGGHLGKTYVNMRVRRVSGKMMEVDISRFDAESHVPNHFNILECVGHRASTQWQQKMNRQTKLDFFGGGVYMYVLE